MTCIDIHSHIVPEHFPPSPHGCYQHWPGMSHQGEGRASVMIGDREFRKLDERSWRAPRRLADMDAEAVSLQALSPMPELLSFWIEPEHTRELGRHVNGVIAGMVANAPSRFAGLGMVPLQDPEMAAKELARLKADGLHGVEIGSNIHGRSPGDAFFDPFYAEAERLGLAIFVHALHPAATDRLVGPKPLAAFIGFPSDVGFAAASFITGRTLEKFPNLRVGFSHGGGTFSSILPRLARGWTIAPELKEAFAAPVDTARKLYFDNIVFDLAVLRSLIEAFGETQVCAGSDYPYIAGQSHPGRPFEALGLSEQTLSLLKNENAKRFLQLS